MITNEDEKTIRGIIKNELDKFISTRLPRLFSVLNYEGQKLMEDFHSNNSDITEIIEAEKQRRNALVTKIQRLEHLLTLYRGSKLVKMARWVIILENGKEVGFGFASYASGDPGGFKLLGFSDFHEFYSYSQKTRDEFLIEAKRNYDKIFEKSNCELEDFSTDDLNRKCDELTSTLQVLKEIVEEDESPSP